LTDNDKREQKTTCVAKPDLSYHSQATELIVTQTAGFLMQVKSNTEITDLNFPHYF